MFIAGQNRTGTTWLANTLAQRYPVAVAQHSLHYGAKEPNIYLAHRYWGTFDTIEEYLLFLATYSRGDYFALAQGDYEYFLQNPASSFYDFYFSLMDRWVATSDFRTWGAKLDPVLFYRKKRARHFIRSVMQRYGEFRLIVISRDFDSYLRSSLGTAERRSRGISAVRRRASMALATARYHHFYRMVTNICAPLDPLLLDYESLDSERARSQLDEFVGGRSTSPGAAAFHRNTSFPAGQASTIQQPPVWLKAVRTGAGASLLCLYDDLSLGRKTPPISWRLTKWQYFPADLDRELSSRGNEALREARGQGEDEGE